MALGVSLVDTVSVGQIDKPTVNQLIERLTMIDVLKHHEFSAEWLDDDDDSAILLTQTDGWDASDPHKIILHPSQLIKAIEHLGLIPIPSASPKIETLTRRMCALRDRALFLQSVMSAGSGNVDVLKVGALVDVLAELANEWCAELNDVDDPKDAPSSLNATQPKQSQLV